MECRQRFLPLRGNGHDAGIGCGGFQVHREAVAQVFHGEFAITEPELRLLVIARGFLGALDDEHGNEGVRRVVCGERDVDDRLVRLERHEEGAEDFFPLDGDERGAFDG